MAEERSQLEKVERLNARNLLQRVSEGKPLTSVQLEFLRGKIGPEKQKFKKPVEMLQKPLSLADFVQLTGLDPRRIQQLKKEGHIPDNGRGKYRFEHLRGYVAYLQGLVQRRKIEPESGELLNLDQQRARKESAMADKIERQNREADGELVNAREVDMMIAETDGIVRTNLLSLPAKLAGELAGTDDPREIQVAIDGAIRKALSELESE